MYDMSEIVQGHSETDLLCENFYSPPLVHVILVPTVLVFGLLADSFVIYVHHKWTNDKTGSPFVIAIASLDILACIGAVPQMPFL